MFGRQRVSSRDMRTMAGRVLRMSLVLAVLSGSAWAQSPEPVSEKDCTPEADKRLKYLWCLVRTDLKHAEERYLKAFPEAIPDPAAGLKSQFESFTDLTCAEILPVLKHLNKEQDHVSFQFNLKSLGTCHWKADASQYVFQCKGNLVKTLDTIRDLGDCASNFDLKNIKQFRCDPGPALCGWTAAYADTRRIESAFCVLYNGPGKPEAEFGRSVLRLKSTSGPEGSKPSKGVGFNKLCGQR